MKRFAELLSVLLIVASAAVMPVRAHAGLIGDTVTASLRDTDSPFTIFSGSAVVTDPGPPEFSGTFNFISWTLDILNNGFALQATCLNGAGCNSGAILLSISGLDFTPPGTLVGLTNITGTNPLLGGAGSPTIGPSSVSISFQAFDLNTNSVTTTSTRYAADFQVTPRVTTPFPATLLLLGVGLAASGILAARRRHR